MQGRALECKHTHTHTHKQKERNKEREKVALQLDDALCSRPGGCGGGGVQWVTTFSLSCPSTPSSLSCSLSSPSQLLPAIELPNVTLLRSVLLSSSLPVAASPTLLLPGRVCWSHTARTVSFNRPAGASSNSTSRAPGVDIGSQNAATSSLARAIVRRRPSAAPAPAGEVGLCRTCEIFTEYSLGSMVVPCLYTLDVCIERCAALCQGSCVSVAAAQPLLGRTVAGPHTQRLTMRMMVANTAPPALSRGLGSE